MGVFVYGKHPGFGDFLSHGLEADTLARLDAWIQPCLTQVRTELDVQWAEAWDGAPPLRMWIGPDVVGTPLAGIWVPSWDRVGRRYPLIVGMAGHLTPPPVSEGHETAFYEALEAELRALDHDALGQGGVQTLIEGIAVPPINGTVSQMPVSGMVWGQRADGDLERLMRDARDTDTTRAQYGRSHWWFPSSGGGRDAGWLGLNGLPDAAAMRWLLAEMPEAQDDDVECHGEGAQT